MDHDIIIVGAGPAGLSFARAVADTGLRVCLLERQAASVLANPPLDGRDIALTHDSMRLMRDLGMWQHIPVGEISPIKSARVISGQSSYFLGFDTEGTGKDALGVLVPNNEIRRAAWKSLEGFDNVVVRDKVEVKKVAVTDDRATVTLADGEILSAPLLIAADSRFSATRAQMSIPVGMKDFGRTAIVCRMTHAKAHDEVAHECFFDDWTLAILPLQGKKSSIVITLPTAQADGVMKMSNADFNARIERNLGDKLGKMELTGQRYAYPLVATYASDFAAPRFALMGDAAVGMHPVTAHGYNLGLGGAAILAREIRKALSIGLDIGAPSVLSAYARDHRRASAFLFYGTNAMVNIYTDRRPAAMLVRALGLRIANRLPPFKRYVTRQLTGK